MRRLNGLGKSNRLRRGRRYLVYRSPWEGQRLVSGTLLAPESGVLSMQRPQRGWGTPLTVELIRGAARAVAASDPLATHLVVGDLSKVGGGCLPPHRSHRGGMDADIGYYMIGGDQRGWLVLVSPETLDADRTWHLLAGFLRTGRLQYAFIDYGLQAPLYRAALRAGESEASLRRVFQYPRPRGDAKVGIIRHLKGHADHMHVRFRCPPGRPCALADEMVKAVTDARVARLGGVHRERRRERKPRRRRATRILPAGW